jgi:pyridoxine 5'-phosphate synthase PdxJ
MLPRLLTVFSAVCLLVLGACQDREPNQLQYTYQKQVATEQQALDDEQVFKHTSGVTRVLVKFDKGRIEVSLFVLEDNKIPGLEKAQELGYQQIHN